MHSVNLFLITLTFGFAHIIYAEVCENGNKLLEVGISDEGIQAVVTAHNKYRQMVADGVVPSQPHGTNLMKITFCDELSKLGRDTVLLCQAVHTNVKTRRWAWVGQNLYEKCSKERDNTQNWDDAVDSWYKEHEHYKHGGEINSNNSNYTQLVWAKTHTIGCNFALYLDYSKTDMPYCKLYVCKYGPGGNVKDELPYNVNGPNECEHLCESTHK